MLGVLLLQAAAFLPPAPPAAARPDSAYRARLESRLRAGELPWEARTLLRPEEPGELAVLQGWLLQGSPRRVRLAAWLAAGAPPASPLSRACARAACDTSEEAAALASLLAPAALHPDDLPAVAYLALETGRGLPLRAAAAARLLDADCGGAWPLARSVLRTGTGADEEAPWADWARDGRYELPKRILLLAVDAWLLRHGEAPSGFEPNAAWTVQVRALAALEPAARRAREASRPPEPAAGTLRRLQEAAGRGDLRAGRALGLLGARGGLSLR